MATTFDYVPLEVQKEILALKSVEAGDRPYCSDSELVGHEAK